MGKFGTSLRRITAVTVMGIVSAVMTLGYLGGVAQAALTSNARQSLFTNAAQEFGVPVEVLLAISYNQTRWQSSGEATVDGGFGLMNLTAKGAATIDGRGDPSRPLPKPTNPPAAPDTLDEAAALLQTSPQSLKTNDQQNVRGAAALLAKYAKQANNGQLPATLNDWYLPVAQFSHSANKALATSFADSIFSTMQQGAHLTTVDNQELNLPAQKQLQPNRGLVQNLDLPDAPQLQQRGGGGNVDCPSSLDCRFIPAAYANNNPADATDYGNYDPANRPRDMKIKYIVIHDTEGSYDSAINHFQNPLSYVSCNYVIRSSDGAVTQMVRSSDVAWCAGDWYVNMHSINIEHEGIAAQGAAWYTEEMYRSSAALVRHLAHKYDIPLDRAHIVGHDQIPALSTRVLTGQHWDPGPYWDWDHYMNLVQGRIEPARAMPFSDWRRRSSARVVKIAPNFATNQPPIEDCSDGTCEPLPAQPSNFVYLRTQPSNAAPLLSDPYLHPDGAPGTIQASDWSAKAAAGQEFVVADRQGDWTAIWFGGQKGWFLNPGGGLTEPAYSKTITPKAGLSSITLYGGAYPEDSAYPPTITPRVLVPLYQIPAGQSYTVGESRLQTDYFYDATYNWSLPDDHLIVRGTEKFYHINFNHRFFYVKANDVVVR